MGGAAQGAAAAAMGDPRKRKAEVDLTAEMGTRQPPSMGSVPVSEAAAAGPFLAPTACWPLRAILLQNAAELCRDNAMPLVVVSGGGPARSFPGAQGSPLSPRLTPIALLLLCAPTGTGTGTGGPRPARASIFLG
jgi:hypothetical protein